MVCSFYFLKKEQQKWAQEYRKLFYLCLLYNTGAVSINGSIFVFGGVNNNNTIEVYCPYKNEWSVLSIKIPNSLECNSICYAFMVNQAIQNKFDWIIFPVCFR